MIPFLDLAADLAEVEAEARRRLDGVLASGQFVLGPETVELEAAMRARTGAASAVAVSSGTEALALALMALGIGPGDAVVVPSFTFIATAGAVARVGATPVFCDVDPATLVAGAREFGAAVGRAFERGKDGLLRLRGGGARLRAFVVVHLYGRAAEMETVASLAAATGAVVVEDAAQAIGARWKGRAVGTLGHAGCFSFYPTKNLGGAGDGGMVTSDDVELGARLARLRTHGAEHGAYEHRELGVNARLGELQAAVLNAKIARLDAWTTRRREIASLYASRLGAVRDARLRLLAPPADPQAHVYHQFAVRIDRVRDDVARAMQEAGVATRVFYPIPLHQQPCFAARSAREGDLPVSEAAADDVLCLPIYPALRDDDAERVVAALVAGLGVAA